MATQNYSTRRLYETGALGEEKSQTLLLLLSDSDSYLQELLDEAFFSYRISGSRWFDECGEPGDSVVLWKHDGSSQHGGFTATV